MANRSRNPRRRQRRQPAAAAARTDTGIGSITGKHCDHSQCGRARTLMEQMVRRDGESVGLDRSARRRVTARIPHMLCTPGDINLADNEYLVLVHVFIVACEEVGVQAGWLGHHRIPNFEKVRAGLLAAIAEQQTPQQVNPEEQ